MIAALEAVYSPPAGKGRRRIYGTVLAHGDDQLCLARRVYSLAEDAGGTGSPRVELWIAVRRSDMGPELVRRAYPGDWTVVGYHDLGPAWRHKVNTDLRRCGFGPPLTDWPRTIWDRRVVLPDDGRWAGNPVDTQMVAQFLRDRNECPDDEVWRIDALIIAYAQHDHQ